MLPKNCFVVKKKNDWSGVLETEKRKKERKKGHFLGGVFFLLLLFPPFFLCFSSFSCVFWRGVLALRKIFCFTIFKDHKMTLLFIFIFVFCFLFFVFCFHFIIYFDYNPLNR